MWVHFNYKKGLKRHIESKHEGVWYPRDKCEYTSTTQKKIWRDILRGNMKEWGIPVINVSTLQLQKRSKETYWE